MKASADPSHEISLQDVVERIHRSLGDQTGGPTLEELGAECDVLYAASFLKEEGEVVRARVVIAPPEGFPAVGEWFGGPVLDIREILRGFGIHITEGKDFAGCDLFRRCWIRRCEDLFQRSSFAGVVR